MLQHLRWATGLALGLGFTLGLGCGSESATPDQTGAARSPERRQDPRPASSNELVTAAVASGQLSVETGLIYQVFAVFGDSRLPSEYKGASTSGGTSTLDKVSERFDLLSEEARTTLQPFLLPPSAPGSWHELATVAANTTNKALEPGIGSSVAALDVEWTKVTAVGGKVTIWSENRYAGDDAAALEIAGELDRNIWQKLFVELGMRTPVSDAGLPNNGGDESFDIYLVHLGKGGDYGVTTPRTGGCVSGPGSVYMTVNTQSLRAALFPTVAHELMHAAQFAYGRTDCKLYWWMEATATWVEDFTYPDLNTEQEYGQSYLDTPDRSIESGDESLYSYGAYLFPFLIDRKYMQPTFVQPTFVQRTWELIESSTTLQAVQAALSDVASGGFTKVWPEFAKYNWNQDPIVGYHDWDGISGSPPESTILRIDVKASAEQLPVSTSVKHLAAKYVRVSVSAPEAQQLKIENSIVPSLVPGGHVWLIPQIAGQWQEPEVLSTEKVYCRDRPEENVTELILVISNSEWRDDAYELPDDKIHLTTSRSPCAGGWSGWIRALQTYDGHAEGATGYCYEHQQHDQLWTVVGSTPLEPDAPPADLRGERIEMFWTAEYTESEASVESLDCGSRQSEYTGGGMSSGPSVFHARPFPPSDGSFDGSGESLPGGFSLEPQFESLLTYACPGVLSGSLCGVGGPPVVDDRTCSQDFTVFLVAQDFHEFAEAPGDSGHFVGKRSMYHVESPSSSCGTMIYDVTAEWDLRRRPLH